MDQDYAPLTEHGKLLFKDEDGIASIVILNRRIERTTGILLLGSTVTILFLFGLSFFDPIGALLVLPSLLLFLIPFAYYLRINPVGPLEIYETGFFIDRKRWPFIPFSHTNYLTRKTADDQIIVKTTHGDRIIIKFDTDDWLESVYPFMRESFNRARHLTTRKPPSDRKAPQFSDRP